MPFPASPSPASSSRRPRGRGPLSGEFRARTSFRTRAFSSSGSAPPKGLVDRRRRALRASPRRPPEVVQGRPGLERRPRASRAREGHRSRKRSISRAQQFPLGVPGDGLPRPPARLSPVSRRRPSPPGIRRRPGSGPWPDRPPFRRFANALSMPSSTASSGTRAFSQRAMRATSFGERKNGAPRRARNSRAIVW